MPSGERGPGGKQPAKVEVIHFPKRGKPTLVASQGALLHDLPTQPIPGLPLDDEDVTDPHFISSEKLSWASAAGRPSRANSPARGAPARAGKGGRQARKTPPPEVKEQRAGLRRKTDERVEKLLAGTRRQLSVQQVAEMSLFGHQLFESGKIEEARVVFEGLVGMDVADSFPYTMLGTIYLALGDPDRALALFEAALQLDRFDLPALVYRGEIRLNRGRLKSALDDFHRAVRLGPGEDPFVERAKRLTRLAQDAARRRE